MLVIKIGGDIVERGIDKSLSNDLVEITEKEKVVIVHGGGDIVTKIAEKMGKKQTFIDSPSGIRSRYTDKETVEIYSMVMAGLVRNQLVAFLRMVGINAVGLSGVDGGLLRAKRKRRLVILDERGRRRIIDGGFTGRIKGVNVELLELIMNTGYVPIVSPIALGDEYEILNVDSDRAAASIAGSLKADKILFFTDVEGLYVEGSLVRELQLDEAEKLLGEVGAGMDKKLLASIEAVKGGAREAVISNGFGVNPITRALKGEAGTVIRAG